MLTPLLVTLVAVAISLAVIRLSRHIPPPRAPKPPPRRPPAPPPAPRPELAAAQARLEHLRRAAFLPVARDGDGPPGASKFAGIPWLAPGEPWPPCGNCGRPMQLFLQLAGDDVPEPARERIGRGKVMQFFFCTNGERGCAAECEAWEPHARSTLLRIVPAEGAPQACIMPSGMFPPRAITGWVPADDFPGWEEMDEAGVDLDEDDSDLVAAEYPVEGEKLLGWPLWVQNADYPSCRSCGKRMELLFQLESRRNLPYIFGDMGIGHVTQCPDHREELAFGWAST